MDLAISPQIKQLIDDRVASGRYATAEDVITAAVMQLTQRESQEDLPADELRLIYPDLDEKIEEGLAALRDGDWVDGDEFFDALEREDAAPSGDTEANPQP